MGRLDLALSREARQLLMADVEISSRRPLPEKNRDQLAQLLPKGSRTQDLLDFVTMVSAPTSGLSRLVELRAVEQGFPFYGRLRLSDQEGVEADRVSLEKLFTSKPLAYVQPELLRQLGVRVGDKIRIGKIDFEIAGTILQEPGMGTMAFSLGPRVLIGRSYVPQTGLVGFGSRVQYVTLVALPDPALAEAFSQTLRASWNLPPTRARFRGSLGPEQDLQVRSFQDSQGTIRHAFDHLADYLRLVSLMALLIGGIGVAGMVRGFIQDHLESIAVLRTLGASRGRILRVYFLQCLGLGAAGSLLGVLLGSFAQNFLPLLFQDLLPLALPLGLSLGAAIWGLTLGLLTSTYFSFLPLLEIRNTKPLPLFRGNPTGGWIEASDMGRVSPASGVFRVRGVQLALNVPVWVTAGLGVLTFGLLAAVEARSLILGPTFIAILLIGGLLLYAIGRLTLPLLSRIRVARVVRSNGAGFGVRHGLSNLARPGLHPHSAVVSLGLAALLLGILSIYEFSLLKDLDPVQRLEELPNFFLIDLQTDQVEELEAFLKEQGVQDFVVRPMVKARYRGLNNQTLGEEKSLTREDEQDQRMRNREQNLSYRTHLSEDETILKGRWMDPNSDEVEASLEEGFAQHLGADVGDMLTLDVQGVEVKARVTSIRKIHWTSFRPNFFILISPRAIADAPQTWVGSISGMDKPTQNAVQAEIVRTFPNVTLLDVTQITRQVLRIMNRVTWAIRFIALFSLGAGWGVLVGIALSTAHRRQRDVVLLKVLGAGRRTLFLSVATEFGLLGAVSGGIGLILATGFGRILLTQFLEIGFAVPWLQFMGIFAGLTILCTVTGVLACWRVFQVKPLEVLREV